jgi:uncharacterized protein (DUF2267 family)
MSTTGLKAFDSTVQLTNAWLNELAEEMGWRDHSRAYHALRAVLQALRDRLTVEEVAALGAQLPMLVRGFYYEGWHPSGNPQRARRKEEFMAEIGEAFRDDRAVDPEQVTRAVFRLLERHVTAGEIRGVKHLLPAELRSLWS